MMQNIYFKLKRKLKTTIKFYTPSFEKISNYFKYRNEIFLVYTGGKVGSTTVYNILGSKLGYNRVYHLHSLTEKYFKLIEDFYNDRSKTKKERKIKRFIDHHPQKKLKIISLVREPMALNVSNFFFHINVFAGVKSETNVEKHKLIEKFNEIDLFHPLNWFDNEFYQYTGLDVYGSPFNVQKGYQIYSYKNIDLLIIRLENINACIGEALEDFIGIEFNNKSVSSSTGRKNNSTLYLNLKNELKINNDTAEKIYCTKYARNFFSKEEIESFKKKWVKE